VYVGIQQMEYGVLAARHLPAMGAYAATGQPFSVAAGRLSFCFGFRGPAVRGAPGARAAPPGARPACRSALGGPARTPSMLCNAGAFCHAASS